MGARPVSGSWKLAPDVAAATQGIVASGFGDQPYGRALFLRFAWPAGTAGGAWLAELEKVAAITDASGGTGGRSAALALTWSGLAAMGLDATSLASFDRAFREGMFQDDRLRRLGDRRAGKWLETVVPGGPAWSGNTPLRDPTRVGSPTLDPFAVDGEGADEVETTTPLTVHALVLLYERDEAAGIAWAAQVSSALAAVGVTTVHELDLLLDVEKAGISREHFGFADGLSQPIPYGATVPVDEAARVLVDGRPAAKDPVLGVPLGEIVIGYQNGHSEPAPGPIVPREIGGRPARQDPRPDAAGLPDHPRAEGFADFGINGSYMVVRELRQDVAAFWNSLAANATAMRAADPAATHITTDWLAERIIGRGRDGHLLCPSGYLKAAADGLPDNAYLFSERDPHGIGCPVGSHVRRANPRDALAPQPTAESRQELLQAANNHRILRRGRKFGPKIADPTVDDKVDRGLLFMCLNTDIARQFEFVQQTWLLNTSFATLFGESDPLLGPAGPMTIREKPLRRLAAVESYVRMAGGEYFFLPSMAAIRYLALL